MSEIIIDYGDGFTVAPNLDGDPAIRIQNKAFVEEPRWLHCRVIGGARARYINELIDALVELRDTDPMKG